MEFSMCAASWLESWGMRRERSRQAQEELLDSGWQYRGAMRWLPAGDPVTRSHP